MQNPCNDQEQDVEPFWVTAAPHHVHNGLHVNEFSCQRIWYGYIRMEKRNSYNLPPAYSWDKAFMMWWLPLHGCQQRMLWLPFSHVHFYMNTRHHTKILLGL